jgi:hypothetical protein
VPTNRNEEAARAFAAPEKVTREQLQPCVVAIKYYMFIFLLASAPKLREPRILHSQRRGRIALGEVEDEVEEGWDGACCKGFDARHGDCWRSCVGGERDSSAISDQAICSSVY